MVSPTVVEIFFCKFIATFAKYSLRVFDIILLSVITNWPRLISVMDYYDPFNPHVGRLPLQLVLHKPAWLNAAL